MSASLSNSIDLDYKLAQAVASGMSGSIAHLYERHGRRVYSLCLRMTGNREEAEDLTQEVFIQLLRKVGSFRGESQFSTWLHRFTTNHVLMHFRTVKRRRELAFRTSEFERFKIRRSMVPLERIELDTAVAKLPKGCRAVFLKYDIEGYNHEEIARIFGCSVGNSKSQLHKARRKLRLMLNRATTRHG
jgi:RNA polymerase sigma-70 factor, ECF subfamily